MTVCIPDLQDTKTINLHAVQMQLEQEAIIIGKRRYREAYENAQNGHCTAFQKPERQLIASSIQSLSEAISDAQSNMQGRSPPLSFIISRVHPINLALVILQEAINETSIADKPVKFSILASKIGRKIGQEMEYVLYRDASKKTGKTSIEKLHAVQRLRILKDTAFLDQGQDIREEWLDDNEIVHKVGAWCLDRLVHHEFTLDETMSLDGKTYAHLFIKTEKRTSKKKRINYVTLSPAAREWIAKAHEEEALMSPLFMPMVIPPVDWKGTREGGYLSNAGPYRFDAIRCKHRKSATQPGLILDVLNALQRTPYRINKRILGVFQELTRRNNEAPDIRQLKQEWIANKFKDYEEIFFCWSADWRGRVYPVQPFLNPQADSTGKALLEFAKGKMLGVDGAEWLAIHGANTYGRDKCAYSERIAWVNAHSERIRASAAQPFEPDNLKFWQHAKKPLMFLAFCFEWSDYLMQGPAMVSHLPVSVDGTCSGLQHYSALLRDEECGQYVNLMQSDRPEDFYAEVARATQRTVEKDTENEYARKFAGRIDRSIVKRNAMTYTYSATIQGFADQITDEWSKTRTEDDSLTWKEARYLADVNLQSIKTSTVKAAEAMDYLQGVARVASKAGIDLAWETPSGFKVDHRYRKPQLKQIKTLFGSSCIRTTVAVGDTKELDKKKIGSSIAPNFIHSLDASHMALTVLACKEEGITDFAMVHDSFGCHAADMQRMNRILRQQFVKMYAVDLLEDFHAQIIKQLPDDAVGRLPGVPMQGTLDLESVHESAYFFS